MKFLISLFFITIVCLSYGQSFTKNTTGRALTFKEVQKQFDDYKKNNNLSQKKHWKSFKRWEYETQLHTNAQGEPAGFADYINAAIEMANSKQEAEASNASSVWSPTGPNVLPNNLTGYMENGIGRINCIAFHPSNANTYFVGVAQGGVWKTTNNGTSWTPLTDNLPITRISDISIDPTNPNTMYISVCDFEYIGVSLFLNGRKRNTHYGLGVYKTTDGGVTWAATGLTFQLTNGDASLIRKVIVNPANSNDLVACGVSGMYKSTNGGTTWIKKLDSLFWDLQIDPANPNILYGATGWVLNSNLGNAGVYKSTDFGNTWNMLNTAMPLTGSIQRVKLAIAPSDPNYIYALTVDGSGGLYGFYKSINAGLTWTFIPPNDNILEGGTGNSPGGQGNYDLGLLVHPTIKTTVYTGGVNIWGSTDGALTFNPVSHWTTNYGPTLHGDIHFIGRQPSTNQFFVCSDGGAYRTANIAISSWTTSAWPTNWTKLNSGMQVSSFYRLSSSKNASGRLVAGAQDNATFYYKGGAWSTIFGGDGMDNYIDPTGSSDVVGSSQYGNFYTSNNDGVSSNYPNTNPNSEAAEWVTPIAADPSNPQVIYIGNENVVQSLDGGNNWNTLASIYTNTTSNTNTEISALGVSASNSLVVYAARRVRYELGMPGMVFKTTNGGVSFSNITNNLPDSLYYTGIEVNETNPNIAYVSMAGFSAGRKVFTTTNGGATWQNISYNLPNIPVNCIKQIPGTNNLIVATDLGVYVLTFGNTSWVSNSFGLPNVIISDIEFNIPLNKVYVSTFGRGIWETSYSVITNINKSEKLSLDFSLFPSVNEGKFSLDFESIHGQKTIEVLDVMGKIVYTQNTNETKVGLNLNLAPGAYYLRLSSKEKLGVKRFIVK
ncbi:MAG: T9SS type A sorting domain-containing protein [Bacteroidetes bacterium]|nr:T9SS type A sorting domain-containing protein [Bacteroidota bacterium]